MQNEVNVKDFRAVGDNCTDDTAAFQSAIAALSPAGGSVKLPAGTYRLLTRLELSGKPASLRGDWEDVTILRWNKHAASAGLIFTTDSAHQHVSMSGFSMVTDGSGTQDAITVDQTAYTGRKPALRLSWG